MWCCRWQQCFHRTSLAINQLLTQVCGYIALVWSHCMVCLVHNVNGKGHAFTHLSAGIYQTTYFCQWLLANNIVPCRLRALWTLRYPSCSSQHWYALALCLLLLQWILLLIVYLACAGCFELGSFWLQNWNWMRWLSVRRLHACQSGELNLNDDCHYIACKHVLYSRCSLLVSFAECWCSVGTNGLCRVLLQSICEEISFPV